METILLSLRAQVAVSTSFMKSPVYSLYLNKTFLQIVLRTKINKTTKISKKGKASQKKVADMSVNGRGGGHANSLSATK